MSSAPEPTRPSVDFSSSSSPVGPRPPKTSGTLVVVLVGAVLCIVFVGALVAAIGLYAYIGNASAIGRSPKPTANRPDEETTYPLPVEFRSAVSDEKKIKSMRPWTSEDQNSLDVLMRRVLAGDKRSLDPVRFVKEMEALNPRLVFYGGKSHWATQLADSLEPPQLMEDYEILNAAWTGENEARVFVWSRYYGEGDVYVYFIHKVDGMFKLYDWRETLEPTSTAQFYNATRVTPEEIEPFETVMGELERIFDDEEIDLETSAEQMLEAVFANKLTGTLAAHVQHYAASYLVAVEASPAQLRRLTGRMAIGEFGGATLWKAIACRERDPETALRYCVTGLQRSGWQPQLTLEAVKAAKETGNLHGALPYIAISLQRMPEIVFPEICEFETDSVQTIIEAWEQREGPKFEESLLTALEETPPYLLGPSRSEYLKEALSDAVESSFLHDLLAYRLEQRDAAGQYELLSRLCLDPRSQRFDHTLVRDFLAAAVESKRLSDAMTLLDSTGRDREDAEATLADWLLPAYRSEGYTDNALAQLKSTGYKSVLLRALILDELGREAEALEELAKFKEIFDEQYSAVEPADQTAFWWYFERAVNCAADLVIRLEPDDLRIDALSAFTRPHLEPGTLLAREYLERREFDKLRAILDGEVEYRSVFEAHLACATASEQAGSAVAAALQDNSFGTDETFSSMGADAALYDLGEEPFYVQDNLVALICESGLASDLWSLADDVLKDRLVEDYLIYSVVEAEIPEQCRELRTLLKKEGFEESVLFHELDAAIAVEEERYFDAAVSTLRDNEHYRYSTEEDTFRTLCRFGIVGQFDQLYTECPDALRGDDHEKWRQLAARLSAGAGDDPVDFAWLNPSFVNYSPAVQLTLARAGLLRPASENAAVWLNADACSIVLGSPRAWEGTEPEIASAFEGWQPQDVRNFPGASSVWTRDTKQGFLVAAVYSDVPPGLDPDTFLPAADIATYLAVAICPKPPVQNAKRLLHRFVNQTFGGTGNWPIAYSIEDSVTWTKDAWQSEMAGFVSGGPIPMQLRDIRSGASRSWKRYRPEQVHGRYGLQYSAIVEYIACERVPRRAEDSSQYDSFALSEPSCVVPVYIAGTHVR